LLELSIVHEDGGVFARPLFVATLCITTAASGPLRADCRGSDLFRELEAKAPATLAVIEAERKATSFGRGKLLQISREGVAPSYLFGTLHLADPRVTSLSHLVRRALANARIVALESVDRSSGMPTLSDAGSAARDVLLAQRNERADRLLTAAEFVRLQSVMVKRGLDRSLGRSLKPTVLALLLDLPTCAVVQPRGNHHLEGVIATIAREHRIPVVGLETTLEQLQELDALPANVQRDLLLATLNRSEYAEDIVETSIIRYIHGDISGLLAWMRSPQPLPGSIDGGLPLAFLDRLLDVRSRRMRDRALPLFNVGGAFVAVGAAHLPGAQGLAQLLQNAGFRVEVME
jgi:uncharacterized protein